MRRSGNAIDDEAPVQRSRMQFKLPIVFGVSNARQTFSITTNQRNIRPYRESTLLGPSETR